LRCRSGPHRGRPRRTNEPHARLARSSPVRAEQLYAVAGLRAESRAGIVQERERGGRVCGGIRRPAALFDSLGSRRRLSGAERLVDRLTSTVRFLRMAASELRRLAERIPEVADELELMARQLEAEADDLTSEPEPSPTV